jgi:hypothetical protein
MRGKLKSEPMSKKTVSRRLFAAGGAGAIMAGFSAPRARAAELTEKEKANIAVVEAFDKNMEQPTLEKLDHMSETCAENIIWGSANGSKMNGLPAVKEWYTNFFKGKDGGAKGLRTIQYDYSETFAKGPVVVMYGLHFVTPPGGPKPAPTNWHCVVHIVKDGKIIERYDWSAS